MNFCDHVFRPPGGANIQKIEFFDENVKFWHKIFFKQIGHVLCNTPLESLFNSLSNDMWGVGTFQYLTDLLRFELCVTSRQLADTGKQSKFNIEAICRDILK